MNTVPLPYQRLCLLTEFGLSNTENKHAISKVDHGAAAVKACELSALWPSDRVTARSQTFEGELNMKVCQDHPFDAWYTEDLGHDIHLDFMYSSAGTKLVIRIDVNLAKIDGVTAMRIALYTLEILEGATAIHCPEFKKNGVLSKLRVKLNFARMFTSVLLDLFRAYSWKFLFGRWSSSDAAKQPNSPSTLFQYYAEPDPQPAVYRTFAPGESKYKNLVSALERWRKQKKAVGFFYLINYAPLVSPGIIYPKSGSDLLSAQKRLNGAYVLPGNPPPPPVWVFDNCLLSRLVLLNNYGKHEHNFKAKATGFKWDWIGMCAPVSGAGAIQINGEFLCWVRGTRHDLDLNQDIFQAEFGPQVSEMSQITHWKN
mmetsp:Transcript_27935/g.38625  ORF Transcript_27935/g.38625 Transcript_27935/m.38625 type:complete len:370 (-) Transcript_27935:164-1273(-)